MANLKLELNEKIGVSDSMHGVMRKVVDVGTEDMVIARFWVQNFALLEKTTFDQTTRTKLENILRQLAEDMLSLRSDIMGYVAEVKRYFEGVKSGEFYEKKENIEYFKEVFHGKKMVEDFYFHAELCKRDALRFLRVALPQTTSYSWDQYYQLFLQQPQHYRRLSDELKFRWKDLDLIRGIRGVIEHGDEDKDFGITDIYLEQTDKGTAFHQPYFSYPEEKEVRAVDGTKKTVTLKGMTVIDIMDKHFWSIFNACESCVVFPLYSHLDPSWQPKQLSLQSMDKKCPIRWSVEPVTNPKKTVNHPPV